MLETIRIQNFKSLRDVTLNLKQINLLIGPNNSGKSNFLKSLEFYSKLLKGQGAHNFIELCFNKRQIFISKNGGDLNNPLSFTFIDKSNIDQQYVNRIEYYNKFEYSMLSGIMPTEKKTPPQSEKLNFSVFDFNIIDKHFYSYAFHAVSNEIHLLHLEKLKNNDLREILSKRNHHIASRLYKQSPNSPFELAEVPKDVGGFFEESYVLYGLYNIGRDLSNLKVYKPNPSLLIKPYPITGNEFVEDDVRNLVSFWDRMKDINIEVTDAINKDLRECISEFKDIRLDTVKASDPQYEELKKTYKRDTFKKLGVSDHKGNIFWAEELSEGALYFIALLAIIHQPNPPKLLLLEEPEKGIHPRRITEVIQFIQRLAHEKDIQVIMTTHSPIVIDQFAHAPESIFVFDKENGETKVRNLQKDIIEPKNRVLEQKGVSPIDYQENLSENWLMGLLNGVPND